MPGAGCRLLVVGAEPGDAGREMPVEYPGDGIPADVPDDPPGRDRLRSEAEPPLSGVFMVSPGSLAWLAQMGFLSPTSAV